MSDTDSQAESTEELELSTEIECLRELVYLQNESLGKLSRIRDSLWLQNLVMVLVILVVVWNFIVDVLL